MRIFGLFLILTMHVGVYGQNHPKIVFSPQFKGEKLRLDHAYSLNDSVTIVLHKLKFYLSDVSVYSGSNVWRDTTRYRLMNLEDSASFSIPYALNNATSISFHIGLDSATNVSGKIDGALDPIHGMYWTWNSGYVNFKLEGTFTEKTIHHKEFEYHLGGYLYPFQTIQYVSLPVESPEAIKVVIDIAAFLNAVDWKEEQNVTVMGIEAKQLSRLLPGMFKLETP